MKMVGPVERWEPNVTGVKTVMGNVEMVKVLEFEMEFA